MKMGKLGVIVDGPGDFAALSARFGSGVKILKTDGPRGHSVAVSKIVSGSLKQINILRGLNCASILIVLDFEKRRMTYASFIKELEKGFASLTVGIDIKFAVPNLMIENWYLADVEHISKKKKFMRDNLKQKNFEGTNGKAEIKKLFTKGITYNEVLHGAQIFKVLRFSVAANNSPSFKTFHGVISQHLKRN